MIRKLVADQSALRYVGMVSIFLEQDEILGFVELVLVLDEFEPAQRSAQGIDLRDEDIGAHNYGRQIHRRLQHKRGPGIRRRGRSNHPWR